MKHIVVTGANGQLGRALSEAEWGPDIRPCLLDRRALDLSRPDQIGRVFEQYNPALLINSAAYTAVDKAEEEQQAAHAVNETAVALLAENCRRRSIPMIHISTDYVFSGNARQPYSETDIPNPVNVYGQSKERGECRLREALPQHVIIRTSGVFGEHGHNFICAILKAYFAGRDLRVVNDQICCPTWTRDLSRMLVKVARRALESGMDINDTCWGTFHYASEPAVSWFQFTREIIQALPAELQRAEAVLQPIPSSEYPTPARRPAFSALDCTKIQQVYGIARPGRSLALAEITPVIARRLAGAVA